MGGIQGLNPWNILMFSVLCGWLSARRREGLTWDMPSRVSVMYALYASVIVMGFVRLLLKGTDELGLSLAYMFSEFIVNCFKWTLPAILLYDGCRSRRRLQIAIMVVLGMYVLIAVQVIRWMPLSYAISGDRLSARAAKITLNEIGYHRVNLSMMLAGASWAVLASLGLIRRWRGRCAVLACAGIIALGQALTGGRAGYVTWAAVGLILCVARWRRLLPLIPIAAIAVCVALPGVRERFTQGFGGRSGNVVVRTDDYKITSGRTVAWPHVIEKIGESPFIGYGRKAMITTGLKDWLWDEFRESFPHPHNAYLELLLDNGVIGFVCVMPFYMVILWQAFSLFLDKENALVSCVGGIACALVLALLIAAVGSQTFYPREGAVGMWAAIALMLRLHVERSRVWESGCLEASPLFADDSFDVYNAAEPAVSA